MTSCEVLTLLAIALLVLHAPPARCQPVQCSCGTRCTGFSPADPNAVSLSITLYRGGGREEKVYSPRQTYRVTVNAKVPIDSFSVCVQRPQQSTANTGDDRIIGRFLPYHTILQQGCGNIVQQSPAFRRRSRGVIQWRWRAPSADIGCFTFHLCAQRTGDGRLERFQQAVTLCPAQHTRLAAVSQQYPAIEFVPAASSIGKDPQRAATIQLHQLQPNEQPVATATPVFSNEKVYEVAVSASVDFTECYIAVSAEEGYGTLTDTGIFTKRSLEGVEQRWRGYGNVLTCHGGQKSAKVLWLSPRATQCVLFRVWHGSTPGNLVLSERRFCKSEWISVCPNQLPIANDKFQPQLQSEPATDPGVLHMERWNTVTSSWQTDDDLLTFRPESVYRVTLRNHDASPFTSCYARSQSDDPGNDGLLLEKSGQFLSKPVSAPDQCVSMFPNALTCHHDDMSARTMMQVTWMSPTTETSCVELRFWLGSVDRTTLQEHIYQLCRLVYVELSSTGSRVPAPSAYRPSQLPSTYPGPLKTGDSVLITLRPFNDKEQIVSDSTVSYYNGGHTYLVTMESKSNYKKCFMMAHGIPESDVQHSGAFTRRHRSGRETLMEPFNNVIECTRMTSPLPGSSDVIDSYVSRVVWTAPGNSSLCVEIVVWLEIEDGELTKVTLPVCRMEFPLYETPCPASLDPSLVCRQCPGSSTYYSLDTNNRALAQRTSCCAGLPHNLGTTTCCSGTIQPRLSGPSGTLYQCCGTRYFDPGTSTCCLNNKQDGAAARFKCCRQTSYNPASLGRGVTACCDGQPYSTIQQKCCSGKLHSAWANTVGSAMRCCPGPNIPYNPITHRCMWCRSGSARVVQPLSIPLACCGGKPYNATDKVCCDQQSEELLDAVSRQSGCCGSKVHDELTSKCCSGVIINAEPGVTVTSSWQCCSDAIYDSQTHSCCDGRVYNRLTERCVLCSGQPFVVKNNGAYQCCGGTAFSRLEEKCCGGVLRALPTVHTSLSSLPQYECCGDVVYNVATNTCCSYIESALVPGALTENHRCCGPKQLYSTISERCVRCPGGDYTVVQRGRQVFCCTITPYTDGSEICCGDGTVARIDVSRPVSSRPEYQCCANQIAYDRRRETCCADGRITDSIADC